MPTAGQESERFMNSHCRRPRAAGRPGQAALDSSISLWPPITLLNSLGERQLKWALGSDNGIEWEKKRATRMSKRSRETRKPPGFPRNTGNPRTAREKCYGREWTAEKLQRWKGPRAFQISLPGTLKWSWIFTYRCPCDASSPRKQSSNKGIALQLPSMENLVFPWTFSTRTGAKAYGKGKHIIYHSNWDTLKEQKEVPLPTVRHKEA